MSILTDNREEIAELRKILRETIAAKKEEEKIAINDMLDLIKGKYYTAREISDFLDGALSSREVAGNLLAGRHSRYDEIRENRCNIRTKCKKTQRHFVEVDENGRVVNNSKVITITDTVLTYSVVERD